MGGLAATAILYDACRDEGDEMLIKVVGGWRSEGSGMFVPEQARTRCGNQRSHLRARSLLVTVQV